LAEPLIVLVIDELANLTAYLTDRQLRDRIPQTTPGVGYVTLEGDPTPMRVRLTYLSDEHIRDIARTYGRLRVIDGETAGGAA
jgi:cytochrome c553